MGKHIQTAPSLNELIAHLRGFIIIITAAEYLSDSSMCIVIALLCSSQYTQHNFSLLRRENGFVSFLMLHIGHSGANSMETL